MYVNRINCGAGRILDEEFGQKTPKNHCIGQI